MTRRLALVLVAFTTALLLVSVLPLGLTTASRDRHDYVEGVRGLARSLATLAEEPFAVGRQTSLTARRLGAAAGADTSVTVYDLNGRVVVTAGPPFVPAADLRRDAALGAVTSVTANDEVVAAAPVAPDGDVRGVVVVARPDEPVEHRVARLWLGLGGIAALALAVSVGLAFAAARWVGRPLLRLRGAADRWADGALDERADVGGGPPEVREVASAFNTMAARLDALLYGSRAVVADVSHQLRTPLAAMRLRLELLRGELGGAGDEDLTAALGELDRLSRLVDGLLAVARAESADVAPVPVDLLRLATERRDAWQPVADERSIAITVEGEVAWAAATPGHLEQVVDNLLANAIDAVAEHGHITLRVEQAAGRVQLAVADDGPGMTAEQQAGVFHRFVTGRPGGAGLGLAIVHRLVTADGGTVAIDSAPDAGTTVRLDLPPARTRHGGAPPTSEPATHLRGAHGRSRQAR